VAAEAPEAALTAVAADLNAAAEVEATTEVATENLAITIKEAAEKDDRFKKHLSNSRRNIGILWC
jgi:hypothetical protein